MGREISKKRRGAYSSKYGMTVLPRECVFFFSKGNLSFGRLKRGKDLEVCSHKSISDKIYSVLL